MRLLHETAPRNLNCLPTSAEVEIIFLAFPDSFYTLLFVYLYLSNLLHVTFRELSNRANLSTSPQGALPFFLSFL